MSAAVSARATVARDGAIAVLSVNRPEARNALDGETLDALHDAFVTIERDAAVRCVIVTGAGDKAFAAGADIKAMADADPAGAERLVDHAHRVGDLLEASRLPVIAAVHGFALGGGFELALACDFIYAARGAKVGFPEVSLGVIPGMGGTQRLVQRVGVARARELLYTGRLIDAEAAARIGLVNEVVEPAELMPRARAVANEIAARAPLAVAAAKRAVRRGSDQPLEAGIALERQLFASLFATRDQKEGMRAFLDKRTPNWTGR
ncbi:MAG TPA: enoyl-CoA hydratase-related protein [Polyangia bacterium]